MAAISEEKKHYYRSVYKHVKKFLIRKLQLEEKLQILDCGLYIFIFILEITVAEMCIRTGGPSGPLGPE